MSCELVISVSSSNQDFLKAIDCHFVVDDIKLLATMNLGLRHVSSRQVAEDEKLRGLRGGCSLGLAPQNSRLVNMDERNWTEIEFHEQEKFVQCFEEGVNNFILKSLHYDIARVIGPSELGVTKLMETAMCVNYCSLSLINYKNMGRVVHHEIALWGLGLGRFPSSYVKGNDITIVPYVNVDDLGYSKDELEQVIYTESQWNELQERMRDCLRMNLLQTLRTMKMS